MLISLVCLGTSFRSLDSSIGVNADTLDELLRLAMSMSGDAPADEAPWGNLDCSTWLSRLAEDCPVVGETSARSSWHR